jgi:hypothetical protein
MCDLLAAATLVVRAEKRPLWLIAHGKPVTVKRFLVV